jgi:hypothetical protein
MKRLGARDFEDLLQVKLTRVLCSFKFLSIIQCSIPVFEGLLPEKHDRIVRKLLFELATWHGLAKLRLHTETTVTDLEHSTKRLGIILREFRDKVCPGYTTRELPSEEAARVRRKANAAKNAVSGNSTNKLKAKTKLPTPPVGDQSRYRRFFNLNTYKTHALGAYPRSIRLLGTSDNYNSQAVSITFNYQSHVLD